MAEMVAGDPCGSDDLCDRLYYGHRLIAFPACLTRSVARFHSEVERLFLRFKYRPPKTRDPRLSDQPRRRRRAA
jgi:hypothetical protein